MAKVMSADDIRDERYHNQSSIARQQQNDLDHFNAALAQGNLGAMQKYLNRDQKWHEQNAIDWMQRAIDDAQSYINTHMKKECQSLVDIPQDMRYFKP